MKLPCTEKITLQRRRSIKPCSFSVLMPRLDFIEDKRHVWSKDLNSVRQINYKKFSNACLDKFCRDRRLCQATDSNIVLMPNGTKLLNFFFASYIGWFILWIAFSTFNNSLDLVNNLPVTVWVGVGVCFFSQNQRKPKWNWKPTKHPSFDNITCTISVVLKFLFT